MSDSEGVLGDGALNPGKYNAALVRRAIREDWPIPAEIRLMVVNQMALVVGRSDNERNKVAAAKVLVSADSVNARRESVDVAASKPTELNVQVNVGVRVVQRDDFYGNEAHIRDADDSRAAPLEAPGPHLGLPGPVQAGGVRPPVGQNGHGSNGSSHGPRPDPGRPQGGH